MKMNNRGFFLVLILCGLGLLAACSGEDYMNGVEDGDTGIADGDENEPDGDEESETDVDDDSMIDGDTEDESDTEEDAAPDGDDEGEGDSDAEPDGDTDGDEDGDGDGEEPLVTKRLHFNFWHEDGFLTQNETYLLHVSGVRHEIVAHDESSKAEHPDLFGESADPEVVPTHYVDVSGLRDDRAMMIYVTQRTDNNGHLEAAHGAGVEHGLAFPIIHIPSSSRRAARRAIRMKSGGTRASRVLTEDELNTYSPLEIAKTIIFHHPELLNLDPDKAANIMENYINGVPGLNDFAYAIKNMGPHGWYDMEEVLDEDDNQVYMHNGDKLYKYILKPETMEAGLTAMSYALNQSKNDPTLAGDSYHPTAGLGYQDEPQTRRVRDGSLNVKLDRTGFHHGFRTRIDEVDGNQITLKFRNDWLRHLSVYLRFYDENDHLLTLSEGEWEPQSNFIQDVTIRDWLDQPMVKFASLVNPVPTIFAVPIAGDYTESQVIFSWPDAARYVEIEGAGLGKAGHYDGVVCPMGVILTGVFELGIPTMLLAMSVSLEDGGATLNQLMGAMGLVSAAIQFFFGILWTDTNPSFESVTRTIGNFMANFLATKAAQMLAEAVIEWVADQAVDEALPFCGWAMAAANLISTTARLTEASVEVTSSPWIIENRLTYAHDIRVVIDHDPDDYEFPATATHYKVTAEFTKSDSRVINGTMPGTTVSDPIAVTFKDVPGGGHVRIKAGFYSDTNWLVGHKSVSVLNSKSEGADFLEVDMAIKEKLVPLDENSVYTHKQKLAIDNGAHVWQAGDAPTATLQDLSTAESGNTISELVNLSVNQATGDLGYVWRAYSADVLSCDESGSGQLYVYQNISAAADPDSNYKFSDCGYDDKAYMFYDSGVEPDSSRRTANRTIPFEERNFALLPDSEGDLYVRQVSLTPDEDFQVDFTKSFCKFPIRLDSAVMHPNGVLFGINHSKSRIFGCRLTDAPTDDADVPEAYIGGAPMTDASQININPILMDQPRALAITSEGIIMLLDELSDGFGFALLHAYDADGSPVAYFGSRNCICDSGYVRDHHDRSNCISESGDYSGKGGICNGHGHYDYGEFSMEIDMSSYDGIYDSAFLSMGVEHKGYIYILYYVDGGQSPEDYKMDIYTPGGDFLVTTTGMTADKLTVDFWRNIYTLNYETLVGPKNVTEPSVSEWIPPTPAAP